MAILLQEEGLLERSLIYATDINAGALERAQSGIYDAARIGEHQSATRHGYMIVQPIYFGGSDLYQVFVPAAVFFKGMAIEHKRLVGTHRVQ